MAIHVREDGRQHEAHPGKGEKGDETDKKQGTSCRRRKRLKEEEITAKHDAEDEGDDDAGAHVVEVNAGLDDASLT